MKIEPVNTTGEYRGVAYTLVGDYSSAAKTNGSFQGRCRWGIAYGGTPEVALVHLMLIIDGNLDAAEPTAEESKPP